MNTFDKIQSDRLEAVSIELRRCQLAIDALKQERAKGKSVVWPSRKNSKAKRASLDLSAALVEFRKSRYDEPKTT